MDRRAAATWLGRLDAAMAELGALRAELAASLPAAAALAAELSLEGPASECLPSSSACRRGRCSGAER
jgi:hypothetical protein